MHVHAARTYKVSTGGAETIPRACVQLRIVPFVLHSHIAWDRGVTGANATQHAAAASSSETFQYLSHRTRVESLARQQTAQASCSSATSIHARRRRHHLRHLPWIVKGDGRTVLTNVRYGVLGHGRKSMPELVVGLHAQRRRRVSQEKATALTTSTARGRGLIARHCASQQCIVLGNCCFQDPEMVHHVRWLQPVCQEKAIVRRM